MHLLGICLCDNIFVRPAFLIIRSKVRGQSTLPTLNILMAKITSQKPPTGSHEPLVSGSFTSPQFPLCHTHFQADSLQVVTKVSTLATQSQPMDRSPFWQSHIRLGSCTWTGAKPLTTGPGSPALGTDTQACMHAHMHRHTLIHTGSKYDCTGRISPGREEFRLRGLELLSLSISCDPRKL